MTWINAYGCSTAAGEKVADLWDALTEGRDVARPWPVDPRVTACLFPERGAKGVRDLLVDHLLVALRPVHTALREGQSLGVILASTKGASEDFIWQGAGADLTTDPLTPVLQEFLRRSELRPSRKLVVSNACSSSFAALALGQRWLAQGLEQVLVVSADAVTSFVVRGFTALKLISAGPRTPFGGDRSGFALGEAAACLLLSETPSRFRLAPIGLDTEGSAVTRPSSSGASLVRAARRIPGVGDRPPTPSSPTAPARPLMTKPKTALLPNYSPRGRGSPALSGAWGTRSR